MPLPSEPEVKKGDVDVFRKATALINRKLSEAYYRSMGRNHGKDISPAGEATFHEKIGAHDILVSHVINNNGFIEWVKKYLVSEGVDNPRIPDGLKFVMDEYINE
ncbi:MAG: hypothetical protein J7K40_10765 [candidate division Zixibacteria bacterium]|nr:hypothetical protein [candidate division Zixibacteria bacterium]